MCGNIVCIAALLLGVDAGWQPLPDGSVQYLIQIEPHLLDALASGEAIQSEIPPEVQNVRGYKITVGTDKLPRALPPAGPNTAASALEEDGEPRITYLNLGNGGLYYAEGMVVPEPATLTLLLGAALLGAVTPRRTRRMPARRNDSRRPG